MVPYHSFDFLFLPSNGKDDTNSSYIDGLVQYCSNSIANALELIQSSIKPSICGYQKKETYMYDWTYIYAV